MYCFFGGRQFPAIAVPKVGEVYTGTRVEKKLTCVGHSWRECMQEHIMQGHLSQNHRYEIFRSAWLHKSAGTFAAPLSSF